MVAISLCVLLLATYCYSVPVNPRLNGTTPDYQYTTGQTMVQHNNRVNMRLMTDAESTGVPSLHQPRTAMGSESNEYTTSVPLGHHMGHVSRGLVKSSNSTSPMDPAAETYLRNFNRFYFTTMETKSQFHKKAIESAETESEQRESDSKRAAPEDSLEAQEEESKRAEREDDLDAQEEESKRAEREDDLDAQEEESKRAAPEDDLDAQEEESKRAAPEDDLDAEEDEAKRAFGNSLEATTYSPSSGSMFTTSRIMTSAESHENSKEQPSSGESFGKTTGLLRKQPPVVHVTRSFDRSSEEFTTASSRYVNKTPVKVNRTRNIV